MQAGSERESTREEQEKALRHVVSLPPIPCGDEFTYVDPSDADVQRVARGAVASENERQGSALLQIPVVEAQVVGAGIQRVTQIHPGPIPRSLALFALDEVNRNSSLPSNVTLLDVIVARANVVEGAGINYSVTVTAAAADAAPAATAPAELLKVVVWQAVPFTAHRLVDFFLLDGGDIEGSGKQKQEGVLLIDCASPPPGHVLLANCTAVPKAGCSVVAVVGVVTWFWVLVSLGLVLPLL
ncbi:unnamed protein product [Closterium sp. Naga37s-1]|nr:unnamed protein product [Closterium sp. Naga37s-1]